MSITNIIKNICTKLGENSKATYGVVAAATANGIFRPTFTMMKKGEDPQSKKYAALREGITEAVAIPTYIACGELAAKFGSIIAEKGMEKTFQKEAAGGIVQTAEQMAERKLAAAKKGKAGLMLIGVCFAAGVVIPGLCSVIVKPIMNKITNKNKSLDVTDKAPEIKPYQPAQVTSVQRPVFKNMNPSMKVGGV